MPKMNINPAFELGELVLLETDPEQLERMVVGILIEASSITYHLRYAEDEVSIHTSIEIKKLVKSVVP
jgi:hypothetical protein